MDRELALQELYLVSSLAYFWSTDKSNPWMQSQKNPLIIAGCVTWEKEKKILALQKL